jgi:prepilin-type N-terminal cleavage/methylation domain-containing protein
MQSIKAFTMIELIMVVVIVGMVSLFAIPNYNKSVAKTYEKTGSNNLLIAYSVQRIKKTNGDPYLACTDVADCNTKLNLSLIGNGIGYSCTVSGGNPPTDFDCRAVRAGGDFTLKVLGSVGNVCCQAGTCHIASACP